MQYKNALKLLKQSGSQLVMADCGTRQAANIVNKGTSTNESIRPSMGVKLLTKETCRFLYRECIFGIVQMRYEYGRSTAQSIGAEMFGMLQRQPRI